MKGFGATMTQEIGPEDSRAGGTMPAENEPRKRRSSAWPWVALAILLLLIIWLIWQNFGRTHSTSSSLKTITTTEIPVKAAPTGPSGGTTKPTKPAKAPSVAEVPDVVGLTRSEAVNALSAAGYVAGVTTVYGTSVPADTVISQNPTGGSRPPQGTTVGIMVQRRDRLTAKVPGLLGLSEAVAKRRAKAAGFKVVLSYTPVAYGRPVGRINSQWPRPGMRQVVGGDLQLQVVIKP